MKNFLSIGFDVSQAGSGKAGCGYYADSLISALLSENSDCKFTLYTNFGDFYFDQSMASFRGYGNGVHYGKPFSSYTDAKLYWSDVNLEQVLGNPNLIHSNNFWCPNQLKKTKLIYTLYDLSFALYPESMGRCGEFEFDSWFSGGMSYTEYWCLWSGDQRCFSFVRSHAYGYR